MEGTEIEEARTELASLFSASWALTDEDGDSEMFQPGSEHVPQPENDQDAHSPQHIPAHSDNATVESLSLTEFVVHAKNLAEHQDAVDIFCKFVLNGVYEGQQYIVDPIRHAMSRRNRIKAARDYDSVLGFGKHIYLDCDITVHPVCKLEDTLQRNIHLKRDFTNVYVRIYHT